MLEITGLHRVGLKPVSLSVPAGTCVAIRGPSGAGKTLLLRAIADLDPSEGGVALDGLDRAAMSAPQWRRWVVYLPAEPGWWADSVGAHFPDWAAAAPLLTAVGLSEDALTWPVARCSTGERLRLALARALSVGPKVLLLDEPTAALDAASVALVEKLIDERIKTGMAALWVTHDAAQAARVAGRVLMVDMGEVREVAA